MTLKRYAAVLLIDHDPDIEGEEVAEDLRKIENIRAARFRNTPYEDQSAMVIIYTTDLDPRIGLEEILDDAADFIEGWDEAPDTKIRTLADSESDDAALDALEATLKTPGKDFLLGGENAEEDELRREIRDEKAAHLAEVEAEGDE
jgi:hypothetical protein